MLPPLGSGPLRQEEQWLPVYVRDLKRLAIAGRRGGNISFKPCDGFTENIARRAEQMKALDSWRAYNIPTFEQRCATEGITDPEQKARAFRTLVGANAPQVIDLPTLEILRAVKEDWAPNQLLTHCPSVRERLA